MVTYSTFIIIEQIQIIIIFSLMILILSSPGSVAMATKLLLALLSVVCVLHQGASKAVTSEEKTEDNQVDVDTEEVRIFFFSVKSILHCALSTMLIYHK